MDLNKYKTWLFDCDGVLLDSNKLKSEAFYEIALPYGMKNAQAFVEYNQRLGGVTRFEKFKYFFETILKKKTYEKEMENALRNFGDLVFGKLISCQETSGVREFLVNLPEGSKKYVVSGGAQSEIRSVFKERGLDVFFNGIYGSPDSKETIMSARIKSSRIEHPAIFIGDSRYDYEVAKQFNLDFLFITKYTEFKDWKLYFANKCVKTIESLNRLEYGWQDKEKI